MQTVITAQDWIRLQEIFDIAVELPSADRARHLHEACKDDPGLRLRIESLLLSVDEDTRFGKAVGLAEPDVLTWTRQKKSSTSDRAGPISSP